MGIESLPLFERLKDSKRILIAGAGGGFDVFSGLPLYFALKRLSKTVHLASLSFSNLYGVTGRALTPTMIEVTANSGGSKSYFPERLLCEWFAARGESVSIHCFHRLGAAPLIRSYQALTADLKIDTVLLVDGGTDSLMRGDEAGLGTPQEDIASIAAVNELDVPTKLLACIGFGVDAYHGVCHAHFLEAVAAVAKEGGFLGAFSVLRQMEEARLYQEAVDYVCSKMPDYPSIVCNSIVSALDGEYGDVHRTKRTSGSTLWINPLMSLYWGFELGVVARRCLYLDRIKNTETYMDLTTAIQNFRASREYKPWDDIPV
ncbi:MAG TPA: DUF1152 domain-containing protein [Planctomycetota bacterium]|nr:DUF1152 domain-containing protein [Planctomycetota bacterium]